MADLAAKNNISCQKHFMLQTAKNDAADKQKINAIQFGTAEQNISAKRIRKKPTNCQHSRKTIRLFFGAAWKHISEIKEEMLPCFFACFAF